MSDVEVRNNAEQSRYEAWLDGEMAGFVAYQQRSESTVLTHTEVADRFEGRGVGSALARGALDDLRAQGRSVVPQCSFITGWIDKHPDYQGLVAS